MEGQLPCQFPTLESDSRRRVLELSCSIHMLKVKWKIVRVMTPDADVNFILFYYAPTFEIQILFDTDSRDQRRVIAVSETTEDLMLTCCSALVGLLAFTRYDTMSAFHGTGKWKLQKPKYQDFFNKLGPEMEGFGWTICKPRGIYMCSVRIRRLIVSLTLTNSGMPCCCPSVVTMEVNWDWKVKLILQHFHLPRSAWKNMWK